MASARPLHPSPPARWPLLLGTLTRGAPPHPVGPSAQVSRPLLLTQRAPLTPCDSSRFCLPRAAHHLSRLHCLLSPSGGEDTWSISLPQRPWPEHSAWSWQVPKSPAPSAVGLGGRANVMTARQSHAPLSGNFEVEGHWLTPCQIFKTDACLMGSLAFSTWMI